MIGENRMKKGLAVFLSLAFMFCLTSCNNDKSLQNKKNEDVINGESVKDELIEDAIKELKSEWEDIYDKMKLETDRYFEIKNTRVIKIKKTDIEEFKDVKYIIEFVLYTDYFGSAPYHSNYRVSNSVIVYNNGDMKVPKKDLLEDYSIKNYIWDYSNIIDNVKDYDDKYNCVENLK